MDCSYMSKHAFGFQEGSYQGSVKSASPNADFCGFLGFVKSRHLVPLSPNSLKIQGIKGDFEWVDSLREHWKDFKHGSTRLIQNC